VRIINCPEKFQQIICPEHRYAKRHKTEGADRQITKVISEFSGNILILKSAPDDKRIIDLLAN
jgi:hypothetical protein